MIILRILFIFWPKLQVLGTSLFNVYVIIWHIIFTPPKLWLSLKHVLPKLPTPLWLILFPHSLSLVLTNPYLSIILFLRCAGVIGILIVVYGPSLIKRSSNWLSEFEILINPRIFGGVNAILLFQIKILQFITHLDLLVKLKILRHIGPLIPITV